MRRDRELYFDTTIFYISSEAVYLINAPKCKYFQIENLNTVDLLFCRLKVT